MNCQKCGRELLETEKFCIACGTPAAPAAQPAPAAPEAEPSPRAGVRCDSCGEELTTDDRFCQSCGAQVGGPAITEGPASRLTEPVEADFEGVDTPGVEPIGSPTTVSPPTRKGSNSTIYTLLGLAFVLIAVSYFAYDYFSTPRSPDLATTPGEQVESAQDEMASSPSSNTINLQVQGNADQRASSGTTAPATLPSNPSPTSTARKPAVSRPRPTSPGTAQQTSPDTSQEEAAGRLNLPSTPPGVAPPKLLSPSPETAQQTSPGTSQEEAAGRLNLPPTPPGVKAPTTSSPPKEPRGGEVLMPGGKASKRAAPPVRANTAPVKPPPAAPPLQKGTIYWTGKLQKNQVIVIEKGEATIGIADGDHFTGIPIDVHLPSPAVQIVERPTAQNNWNRVAFRCLRTTKQSVTINIQWNLLR